MRHRRRSLAQSVVTLTELPRAPSSRTHVMGSKVCAVQCCSVTMYEARRQQAARALAPRRAARAALSNRDVLFVTRRVFYL